MKDKFQSKAVPRGTRTIWRYLSAFILLFSLSIGQMWGAEVTVGFTTATGANGSNTTRSIVEEDHITVTHILNSGTSGALALYTNSDKSIYYGSSTAVYTKGGYKWNKNTGTTFNDNYVGFQVDVEDGYKLSLSELELTLAVSAGFTCKVEITDGSNNLYSSDSWAIANNGKNGTNGINPTFTAVGNPDLQDLTGTFYVRVQLAFSSTGKYLCCPIFTVTGELETATPATTHTLTWDFDGGSCSATAGTDYTAGGQVAEGATITYPANNTMSKPGKDFDGWSSSATTMPTSDLKITAQWKDHSTSSDATLSALSVAGCTFNETFDPATFAYTVDLPFYASMPTTSAVTATKNDSHASDPVVSISGNVISVEVTPESGAEDKKTYTITVNIADAPTASNSLNLEQNVLDNTKSWDVAAALAAANIVVDGANGLDSLNDVGKTARNYGFLGLKLKKNDADIIRIVLPASNQLNVKLGSVGEAVNVIVNGAAYSTIAKRKDGVSTIFHLDAAAGIREVIFHSTANETVTLQQVKIGADVDEITLPWLVTYNAGEHGTCATAKEVWTGTALTLPAVTPESGWDFNGWNDDEDNPVSSPYIPTKNATLTAQYSAQASPFDLTALTYKIGTGDAVNVGYEDGTFTYNIELPYKPSYDAITVAPTLKEASSSLKGDEVLTVTSLPGAATFTVVASNASEQLYTVNFSKEAKDGTSLIKAVATATAQDITGTNLTGAFKGAAHIETANSYKLNEGKYFMVQLVAGQNFQAGDIVKINVSAVNDCNGFTLYSSDEFTAANLIIDTHTNSDAVAKISADINEVELPSSFLGSNKLYVARADGADKYLNAGINQVEVTRVLNPQLLAITIDGRDGVINEAAKTVAVQIPYEADLANLTIVPTIAWNAPAAENSIVVNDGGAWVEGNNTYKLTDKDGDYTIYTLTLTRDVQKFVVTYFDGETNLGTEEVEKNGHPTATGIVAPTKKGQIFLGWNQSSTATAAEDLNDITIKEAKNLYAIYEDIDCSGTGVKFSMTPKANELTENYEPKGDEERDYAEYATLVGGKVFINNVAPTDKRISVLKGISEIKLEGGENAYIHVELDCPLNENDTIKIVNDQKWQVSITKGSGYVAKEKADKYHLVPAAWDGKYDFYIKRNSSNLTVSGIQVVRPAKFDVSFNMMGHGSAIADIEDVIEGSKITAPTAPTDADYSFAGWYKENTLANEWKFDVDVVEANTTLYAKWLDKSDATLKSLKYGETEIALEAGVYTYNVSLPAFTSAVPALTAETSNPNATKVIANAAAFDSEGNATSTVTVTPEVGADQVYYVNFAKGVEILLQDVTGSITWNFANAVTANVSITETPQVLANYGGVTNDNTFESDKLEASGEKFTAGNKANLRANYIHFRTTVPGILSISYSNTGGSNPARYIYVNGVKYDEEGSANTTPKGADNKVFVPAGDVELVMKDGEDASKNVQIYQMIFNATPDYTRDVTEGKYGTICLPTNGVMTNATIYTLAYFGETSQKFFFDEVLGGVMEAGKPYLFLPEQGVTELKVFYTDSETKAAQTVNGFVGFIGANEDDYTQVPDNEKCYIIQNNTYRQVLAGAEAYIKSYRAYIDRSEDNVPLVEPAKAPGARRIGLGKDAAQGFENLQSGDQPMKVMIDGTLYIIRGEKVYNANGQVVK